MKTALTTLSIIVFTLIVCNNQLHAQSPKVDFKAEWKDDSVQNIVKVNITVGEPKFIMLYDNSPFEEGKLLNKTEVLSDKTIEIITEKRIKLFICAVRDSISFNCKWLDIEK